MVAPINPRNRFTQIADDLAITQEGFVQKRPFDRSLPYYTNGAVWVKHANGGVPSISWQQMYQFVYTGGETRLNRAVNQAKIIAYERFKNKFGDRAEWLVNLAELDQACKMVERRCLELLQVVRNLRRGDIAGAAKLLRTQIPATGKKGAKFGDVWLEMYFGWSPLLGDIKASVDILQNPLRDVLARGTGKNTLNFDEGFNPVGFQRVGAYQVRVLYQSLFSITNPNLFLANQLGLLNPVTVAWELIPYSFVVDWFVNVSQFFQLGSDMFGVSLKNPFTTVHYSGACYSIFRNFPLLPVPRESWGHHWVVSRVDGISGPTIGLRPWKLWSWQRALTASSLLAQKLSEGTRWRIGL
jgi:hypothetical protein